MLYMLRDGCRIGKRSETGQDEGLDEYAGGMRQYGGMISSMAVWQYDSSTISNLISSVSYSV